MTTKEQERKALTQIRKIVNGLGEDSYIATAFEGCFEIAEQNIENDWACSMKQRAESAEQNKEGLEFLVKDLGEKLQAAYQAEEAARENHLNEIRKLKDELREARKHIMSYDLYRGLWTHFYDEAENNKQLLLQAADIMARYADAPQDIAFQNAIKRYKSLKDTINSCEWFIGNLEEIAPEEDDF